MDPREVRYATVLLAATGGHLRRRTAPEIVLFFLHLLKVTQIVHFQIKFRRLKERFPQKLC